ncbi:nucleotidyltransferase family protein [Facilibium subflavum]|uniref:nucleotidyltransferase family protein n=1 Tax=Facilibium subflavum TaxID=2219058 RepID=UPI001AADA415|nr:nucleotidyltransferase family protein [Facilibium subflavum]
MEKNKKISAMILAAGRGTRMKPFTDTTPKPLIKVNGITLIERQISALAQAGIQRIVINVAYLGQMIVDTVGFGQKWGVEIIYLHEPVDAFDTGGGIVRALPWLSDAFIVANADVFTDYNYKALLDSANQLTSLAHLVLVPNPKHNLQGDFSLSTTGCITSRTGSTYTYAGISICKKALFTEIQVNQRISLPAIWQSAIDNKAVTGEIFHENWCDVGTPERWQQLNV